MFTALPPSSTRCPSNVVIAMTDEFTNSTLLVTVTGRDRPGVSARLLSTLSVFPVTLVDLEQVVIGGRLVLGALLDVDESVAPGVRRERLFQEVRSAVEKTVIDLDMVAEFAGGNGRVSPTTADPLHVTILASPLRPGALGAIASCVARAGANIDRIERLASYPVTSIELDISGADPEKLRGDLSMEAATQSIDVAVQSSGLHRRAKHLVVMDVDSTLIQGEVIELLADHAGCAEEVARVTEEAMRGELDFEESLRRRVALLEGLDASAMEEVRDKLVLTPGARTLVRTLKRLGYECAIVSGGFSQITDAWWIAWISTTRQPTLWKSSTASSPVDSSVRSSTGRARPSSCSASRRRPVSPSIRPWPSVTVPTTSTCCRPRVWESRSTPSPWCASRPTRR